MKPHHDSRWASSRQRQKFFVAPQVSCFRGKRLIWRDQRVEQTDQWPWENAVCSDKTSEWCTEDDGKLHATCGSTAWPWWFNSWSYFTWVERSYLKGYRPGSSGATWAERVADYWSGEKQARDCFTTDHPWEAWGSWEKKYSAEEAAGIPIYVQFDCWGDQKVDTTARFD